MRADVIDALKRRLGLLARLDGEPLWTVDGLFAVRVTRILAPFEAVSAFQAGLPRASELGRWFDLARTPVRVDEAALASARRTLLEMATRADLGRAVRSGGRAFRRYGELDAAWVRARRSALAELEGALAEAPPSSPWERTLALVRARYGRDAVAALEDARARLLGESGAIRERAVHALRLLPELVRGDPLDAPPELRAVVGSIQTIAVEGRARRRRIAAILGRAFGVEVSPRGGLRVSLVDDVGDACRGATLPELVRVAEIEELLAAYASAFTPADLDRVRVADVRPGLDEKTRAVRSFHIGVGKEITVPEALALARFATQEKDLGGRASRDAARLVADGIGVETIEHARRLGLLAELLALAHERAAAETFVSFLPFFERVKEGTGKKIPLTAALARTLARTCDRDTGLLLACMLEPRPDVDLETRIAHVDTILALFQTRPVALRGVLARLRDVPPGAGRSARPDTASAEPSALLDELVHLSAVLGEPPTLPRAVAKLIGRASARTAERAFLEGRARSGPQARRLAVLLRDEGRVDHARVRRALEAHVAKLRVAAFEAELDALLVGLVGKLFGVRIPSLTPAWRDVIRFALVIHRNRALLRTLVREAAEKPGVLLAPTRPPNRAWLAEAAARFTLAAWLDSTPRDVTVDGVRYTLRLEPDALEVLRMGIPFDTCLSLEDGVNASSTITNALDANKRVLYARSEAGAIVARKLLAVSSDWKLVGYHTYIAVSGSTATALAAAMTAFCVHLARATGLELGNSGEPVNLHRGFWYDDGVEPFQPASRTEVSVEAYATMLGLGPTPPKPPASLVDEARAVRALFEEDAAALPSSAGSVPAPFWAGAAASCRRLLGDALCLEGAETSAGLATLLVAAPLGDVRFACEVAARADSWMVFEAFGRLLQSTPSRERLAFEIAAIARRRFPGATFDDHGYEHRSLAWIPDVVGAISPARGFALADAIDPVWRWLRRVSPPCRSCVDEAEARFVSRAALAFLDAPEPDALLASLRSARRSALAGRLALFILARSDLDAPRHEITRALRRAQRDPDLAGTPLFWAASARHHGERRRLGPLPAELDGLFEALGPLVLRADVAERLLASPAARVADAKWRPSRWEAFFHRRFVTPGKVHLRGLAARGDVDALERLAELGDTEGLRGLLQRTEAPRRAAGASSRDALVARLELAERVRSHVVAIDAAPLAPVSGLATGAIDASAVVRARAILSRRLQPRRARAGSAPPSRGGVTAGELVSLEWAFAVVLAACDEGEWSSLVALLAERPVLLAIELRFLREVLGSSRTLAARAHPLTLARLWAREGARDVLAGALAEGAADLGLAYPAVASAARGLGVDVEGLLEAWVIAVLDKGHPDHLDDLTDAVLQRDVFRILLRSRITAALDIYRFTDAAVAAIFLEEAGPAGLFDTPEAAAFVESQRKERPHHAAWFESAMTRWREDKPGTVAP